jgi:hemoglobin-like flavoprotein
LETEAADLGKRHRDYGVRAVHYRLAREAMEGALVDTLGDRFGPKERAAWRKAYNLIAELMQV